MGDSGIMEHMAYIDVSLHGRVLVRLSDDLAADFGSCFWWHCGEMEAGCTYGGCNSGIARWGLI